MLLDNDSPPAAIYAPAVCGALQTQREAPLDERDLPGKPRCEALAVALLATVLAALAAVLAALPTLLPGVLVLLAGGLVLLAGLLLATALLLSGLLAALLLAALVRVLVLAHQFLHVRDPSPVEQPSRRAN